MTTPLRMQPEDRQAAILAAAVQVATDKGYQSLTRDHVAEAAGVSPALVTRYYYHMDLLRAAVLDEAVRQSNVRLVAEGLACGQLAPSAVPRKLRIRAAMAVMGVGA